MVRPLHYEQRLELRDMQNVDLVVIHCTELPDLAEARRYGERVHHPASRTGNSGHFYIDRDGSIECWVVPERVAHHVRGYNPRSIGIELVNRGRYPNWFDSTAQVPTDPYPDEQIDNLVALLAWLTGRYPTLGLLAGHEDLDRETVRASDDPRLRVRRKRDPGPRFPWSQVLARTGLRRFDPA